MKSNKNLKIRLDELMLEKGINCVKLAKEIGVTQPTITRWKNGTRSIPLNYLIKIANYFNCSLDYLVGRSDVLIEIKAQTCPPFYTHLRELMQSLKISRNKINRETKVKSSHFVGWNRGSEPALNSLIELADYLKVTLDELVGRE